MNFKQQAKQLESFLEEEFKFKTPLLILSDKSILYKDFKISLSAVGSWDLSKDNRILETFKSKSCATVAAKMYDRGDLKKFADAKMLDTQYWQHTSDEFIFKHNIDKTKDMARKDMLKARWQEAHTKAAAYRSRISSMFKLAFDK